jgi:transketolase
MLALAAERPDFVALTADLMYATGMAAFGAAYPERLINLGIAEQNMTGVAAGLALCGKLPSSAAMPRSRRCAQSSKRSWTAPITG